MFQIGLWESIIWDNCCQNDDYLEEDAHPRYRKVWGSSLVLWSLLYSYLEEDAHAEAPEAGEAEAEDDVEEK